LLFKLLVLGQKTEDPFTRFFRHRFFLERFFAGLLTVTDLYTADSVRVERNRYLREPGQLGQRIRERESVDFCIHILDFLFFPFVVPFLSCARTNNER
jgi:hypothetical protein